MSNNSKRGLFIVFEAVDGSGTSTQARMLYDYLLKNHYRVYLTEEPSPGPIGNMIRLALNGRMRMTGDKSLDDRQLALLFAADRHDHLYNEVDGIMHKINDGWIVICTRYLLSSMVYNCNNEEELEYVRQLNSQFPLPDLTIFIECPVEICVRRLNEGRPMRDIYENYDKLLQVKKNYERLLKEYKALFYVIDGTVHKEVQHNEIVKIINSLVNRAL